jgi:hypothetical protein
MVTYDQYDQPDYFYDNDTPENDKKGGKLKQLISGRRKNKSSSKDNESPIL